METGKAAVVVALLLTVAPVLVAAPLRDVVAEDCSPDDEDAAVLLVELLFAKGVTKEGTGV